MDLSLALSRSGSPTCAAGGVWLHSRYEPEREAFRFAESEIAAAKPSHVVLLGPCLDYLSVAVRILLPRARIIAVQYSAFFIDRSVGRADSAWFPGSAAPLEAFFDSALDEDAISGVAVLEWEPASRAFPVEALAARTAVKASLDRLVSSTATVKSSGRRWIANACAAFLLVERAWEPVFSSVPILVAAAGPSLRQSLLELSSVKGRFTTIAVSSALAACRCASIEPDIIVATDGGYWSRLHLYPLVAKPLPLASPLTALPSSAIYSGSGLVLLDQGSFAESELLPCLCPALAVPPHGTVSGTAIQLAAGLTDGPIIVAGLDLASLGELDHARPHGFDPVLGASVSRVSPLESLTWARSIETTPLPLLERPWRGSRSLAAYASALALEVKPLAKRIFRMHPSPIPLPGFADIDTSELESLVEGGGSGSRTLRFREISLPSRGYREAQLGLRLASWRDRAAMASKDLGLDKLPSNPLVAELLRSIDIVDYAAARRAILSGGDPGSAARDLASHCDLFISALERRFAS
jgi:Protein of unknown function DUF115